MIATSCLFLSSVQPTEAHWFLLLIKGIGKGIAKLANDIRPPDPIPAGLPKSHFATSAGNEVATSTATALHLAHQSTGTILSDTGVLNLIANPQLTQEDFVTAVVSAKLGAAKGGLVAWAPKSPLDVGSVRSELDELIRMHSQFPSSARRSLYSVAREAYWRQMRTKEPESTILGRRILALLPKTDAEFESMFGRQASAAATADIKKATKAYEEFRRPAKGP